MPSLRSTLLPQNIYTESDLSDADIYERLMKDVARLEDLLLTYDRPLPSGASLMIDVFYDDERSLQTEYYYADHNERVIFFLHPSNTDEMRCAYKVRGPKSYPHLGMLIVLRIKTMNLLSCFQDLPCRFNTGEFSLH